MTRRDFIHTTAAVTAGIVTLPVAGAFAKAPPADGIIDVNVTLGRWPFRRLPDDETGKLVTKLRRVGVTQAWAASYDAVFAQDLRAANAKLVAQCRAHGRGVLAPFGSVNPKRTDWESEFVRCVEEHRICGLRLFPGYHGYKLGDESFVKLFARAAERKIVLQIAADLEDERLQHKEATAPHLDAKPLVNLLKLHPSARVVLLNWQRSISGALVQQLAAAGARFDIATVENVGGVAELIGKISAERVLFGSHAPFFYFESALLKLKESALKPESQRAVCELNPRRLLG